MEVVAGLVFTLVFVVLIWLADRYGAPKAPTPLRFANGTKCQYCGEHIAEARWHGQGWTCCVCWSNLGLYDRNGNTRRGGPKWKVADVKIEEIHCGDKL